MSGAALTSAMHKPDATGLDTYAVAAAVGAGGSIAAETARGRPILRRNSAIWDQRPADEGRKARRVSFAQGPLATGDGHPAHEGVQAATRSEHPGPPQPLGQILHSQVPALEEELGPENLLSLNRLKRRIGLLPPLKRNREHATPQPRAALSATLSSLAAALSDKSSSRMAQRAAQVSFGIRLLRQQQARSQVQQLCEQQQLHQQVQPVPSVSQCQAPGDSQSPSQSQDASHSQGASHSQDTSQLTLEQQGRGQAHSAPSDPEPTRDTRSHSSPASLRRQSLPKAQQQRLPPPPQCIRSANPEPSLEGAALSLPPASSPADQSASPTPASSRPAPLSPRRSPHRGQNKGRSAAATAARAAAVAAAGVGSAVGGVAAAAQSLQNGAYALQNGASALQNGATAVLNGATMALSRKRNGRAGPARDAQAEPVKALKSGDGHVSSPPSARLRSNVHIVLAPTSHPATADGSPVGFKPCSGMQGLKAPADLRSLNSPAELETTRWWVSH